LAKGHQTFHKRQRERKRREKAQLKRERREQRREEKKGPQGLLPREPAEHVEPNGIEPDARDKPEGGEIPPPIDD
jgi:hypothetical protein